MNVGEAVILLVVGGLVGMYFFGTVQGRALLARGLEYAKGLYARAKGTR